MDAPVFKAIQPEVSILVCFSFPLCGLFFSSQKCRTLCFKSPQTFPCLSRLPLPSSKNIFPSISISQTDQRFLAPIMCPTPAPLKGFRQAANGKIRLRCSVTMNFHLRLIDLGRCFSEQTKLLSHGISSWLHNRLNTTTEPPQSAVWAKQVFLNWFRFALRFVGHRRQNAAQLILFALCSNTP